MLSVWVVHMALRMPRVVEDRTATHYLVYCRNIFCCSRIPSRMHQGPV